MVSVLVAKKMIPAGGIISASSVSAQLRPRAYAGDARNRVTPNQLFNEFGELISNVAVPPGSEIYWTFVKTADTETALSSDLGQDMRLVTLPVDEIKSIAGHIQPNDFVDVLWTGNIPSAGGARSGEFLTKVLLEGVTVAAVGQSSQPRTVRVGKNLYPTSVTLKLSQDEAAKLVFAESVGKIRLVLRESVVPQNLVAEGKKEFDYGDIKEKKTVSNKRGQWIEIIYGKER